MRVISLFMVVVLGCCLSGCAGSGGLSDKTTEEAIKHSTDRHAAWEQAEEKRLAAIGKMADAKKAEAEARKAEATANSSSPAPQFVITDAESMKSYERIKATEALAEANRLLAQSTTTIGEVAKALAGEEGDYAPLMKLSPMPKGVIAESIESLGTAGEKIANTPAAFILGTGQAMKWVAKQVKGNVNAKDSNVKIGDGDQTVGLDGEAVEKTIKAAKEEPSVAEEAAE